MLDFLKPIEKEISVFEDKFKNTIFSDEKFSLELNEELKSDLKNLLFLNSKRLRPIFIFLFSKILKINDEKIYDLAILSELAHSASIVHDDIIDDEKTRRNQQTLNIKYNSKIAVLIGDLLLAIFLEKISKTNLDFIKIYSKYIKKTILAEISQDFSNFQIPTLEEYYSKTFNKTGNLFLCGLEGLLSLKNINEELKDNLISFVKDYSLAFQIQNDINNFRENFSDFKNGNYTLAVIYFSLENSLDDLDEKNIEKYLKKAQKKVEELKNKTIEKLNLIEESIYKRTLIELVNFTLER